MKTPRFTLLIAAIAFWPTHAALAQDVTFDLDSGTPALSAGQSLPVDQTVGGLSAHFSGSPSAGSFSIQTDTSTGFSLSQFSGHYIYPNSLTPGNLNIKFGGPLTSIGLTFATADFHQVEQTTTIKLTAYDDSSGTPVLVGSTTASGTYGADTMPMGTIAFASATPFNLVVISVPPAPSAATQFLVDNVVVTRAVGSVWACVLDRNRQPLPGAEIHLFDLASGTFIPQTVLASADGTATLTDVPPGRYHIGAYVAGKNMWIFSPSFAGWNVTAGGTTALIEIVMDNATTATGAVQGFFRYDDATGAHPIGLGAHVDVYSGGHLVASTDSDANGRYVISGLPSINIDGSHPWWGWYTYIATWNGHKTVGVNFGVWAPLTIRMDIPFKL